MWWSLEDPRRVRTAGLTTTHEADLWPAVVAVAAVLREDPERRVPALIAEAFQARVAAAEVVELPEGVVARPRLATYR